MPARLVSHLIVVSVVLGAATAGLASGQPETGGRTVANSGFFVSAARGASGASPTPPPVSLLQPVPSAPAPTDGTMPLDDADAVGLDRGQPAVVPSEPLATPVPLDPDATPLAPPTAARAQGSGTRAPRTGTVVNAPTTRANAPTTRAVAPAPALSGLVWPVPGGSVSQYFHAGHLAVDIAAPYGSAVVAAQAGIVSWSGWRNNGGGYVISIDHGNGMATTYNHLGDTWVAPGQYVAAGQMIAPVGCTGICTGPHVHFELRTNGVIDNPMRWF